MSVTVPLATKFPPVVDIKFCSNLDSTFTVRKIPSVPSNVGGVGSIVIIDSDERKKFTFKGSALKDSDENLILTVKTKDQKQWEASLKDDSELLFTLNYSGSKNSIKVSLTKSKRCDYEIEKGSLGKDKFTISNMSGGTRRIAAEVNLNNLYRDDKKTMNIKSTYDVTVKPGYDQAFIFGLVAVLEQLHKAPTKKKNIH